MEKLNGLDLFSGIGGITKALEEWITPLAYCECDRYAQAVLLSRMQSGDLPTAPIWDDVRSLPADLPTNGIDIIYGGFPCQDISVAGAGEGLAGERSGLFSEIVRLADEVKPTFLFLENVPAIRTRGLDRVIQELTEVGYDLRWLTLSAADVGANHKRERWFLLAHTDDARLEGRNGEELRERTGERSVGAGGSLADTSSLQCDTRPEESGVLREVQEDRREHDYLDRSGEARAATVADAEGERRPGRGIRGGIKAARSLLNQHTSDGGWWDIEPNVGRVANGIPRRVDRLKCCGNAVVPLQAKTAFKILMGL